MSRPGAAAHGLSSAQVFRVIIRVTGSREGGLGRAPRRRGKGRPRLAVGPRAWNPPSPARTGSSGRSFWGGAAAPRPAPPSGGKRRGGLTSAVARRAQRGGGEASCAAPDPGRWRRGRASLGRHGVGPGGPARAPRRVRSLRGASERRVRRRPAPAGPAGPRAGMGKFRSICPLSFESLPFPHPIAAAALNFSSGSDEPGNEPCSNPYHSGPAGSQMESQENRGEQRMVLRLPSGIYAPESSWCWRDPPSRCPLKLLSIVLGGAG